MANQKFRIGISSGFLTPGQNNVFSLPQKLSNVITWGVDYTQIDIQSTSEISKLDFLPGIRHIVDSLKMRYGMHAEINESVGMDWAITNGWDPCHMKLNEYLDLLYDFFYVADNPKDKIPENEIKNYLPEYIDFHITQAMAIPPRSTQNELITAPCNTPWGRGNWNLHFFHDEKGNIVNGHLQKWFMINILKLLYEKMAGVYQAYENFKGRWMLKQMRKSGNTNIDSDNLTQEEIEEEKLLRQLESLTEDQISDFVIDRIKRTQTLHQKQIAATNDPDEKIAIKELMDARTDRLGKIPEIIEERKKIREALIYLDGKDSNGKELPNSAAKDFDTNGDINPKYKKIIFGSNNDGFLYELYDDWLTASRRNNYEGTIVGEQYAYLIIAKYLEYKYLKLNGSRAIKEKLAEPGAIDERKGYEIFWDTFINYVEKFEKWKGRKGNSETERTTQDLEWQMTPIDPKTNDKRDPLVKTVELDGTINLHTDIVAMVASFYIVAHFETPMSSTDQYHEYRDYIQRKGLKYDPKFHEMAPIEKLNKLDIVIAFENPHLLQNLRIPGTQRIVKAIDMEKFARAAKKFYEEPRNFKLVSLRGIKNHLWLLLDFGWWQANGMDPIAQVDSTSSKFGEYVKAIQLHYAYAGGAHYTIDIGSTTHERMYTWLYKLMKKGMNDVPVVFERGGGNNPFEVVRTSVFAMRTMMKMLEQDKDPEKPLPKEFYGFSEENLFSTDRQLTVVREHAFDPIKGMLEVKEFEHGFLGGHAIAKGKRPEEFAKERLK